jgi:hypothetical protein
MVRVPGLGSVREHLRHRSRNSWFRRRNRSTLIFLGFTVTVAWRWAQVRVVGGASELSVRNVFLTYHIQREAIAGFRSGRFGQLPWGPNIIMFDVLVRVVLKDGRTVALLATMSYIYSFMSSDLPAGHQRALAQLEEWLHPGLPATPTATV